MATSFQTSQVEHIVQQGWRRRLLVLAVDQSAIALAVVFAGFALLILLGTQILAWPWLLGIAAVGIGLSVSGVRRRISDAYTVAQMMDQHLDLKDSLSTAWFLQTKTADTQDQTVAAYQLRRAEELAQTADPAAAFPFQRQRAWLITAALALLAVGLFSARYLVTRELNLQHTFLPLAITQVIEYVRHGLTDTAHNEQAADAGKAKGLPPTSTGKDAEHRPPTPKPEQGQTPSQQQAKGGDSNSKSNQSPDPNAQPAKNAEGQSGENKRNGEGEGSKNGNQEAGNKPPSDQSQQQQQQQDTKQQENGGQQRSASMMDRMRDALSSVMSKIKPAGNRRNRNRPLKRTVTVKKAPINPVLRTRTATGRRNRAKNSRHRSRVPASSKAKGRLRRKPRARIRLRLRIRRVPMRNPESAFRWRQGRESGLNRPRPWGSWLKLSVSAPPASPATCRLNLPANSGFRPGTPINRVSTQISAARSTVMKCRWKIRNMCANIWNW